MAHAEEHKIREYLLGQLTGAEEEQVELRLLTEPDFAAEYDIVVNEVTDDYIAGKFEGEELKQVESHFFKSSERQNRLKFAQALNHYSTTANPSGDAGRLLPFLSRNIHTVGFRASAVIMIAAMMAGAFWLIHQRSSAPQTFATLTLSASPSERWEGGPSAVVTLPLNADALMISLRLPKPPLLETAVGYRCELENNEGQKKALGAIAREGQSVTVAIPAAELKRGQYFLRLFAIRSDGTERRIPGNYLFTVE
jgi:hypothetical protein